MLCQTYSIKAHIKFNINNYLYTLQLYFQSTQQTQLTTVIITGAFTLNHHSLTGNRAVIQMMNLR